MQRVPQEDAETDHSLDPSIQDRTAIFTTAFSFEIGRLVGGVRIAVLATALDQNVSLEGILAGETLIAVGARERLHRQMNSLVSLQIVISIEALRALVALKRSIGSLSGHSMRGLVGPIEMLSTGDMSTVESREETRLHATHHGHGTVRTMYIGHDRPIHGGK